MNEKEHVNSGSPELAELRRMAEQHLREEAAADLAAAAVGADARALLHELQVHQIELEMQNEELERAHAEAREASEKYYDLFDFAPIGYFVWEHEGRILEVNLAGAALLGLSRKVVVQKRFGQFVAGEHRPAFADFCRQVLTTGTQQTCEVKLLREGQFVDVLVEGIAVQDRQGQGKHCCAAVIDVTQQKRADELALANEALHKAEAKIRSLAEFPEESPHPILRASADGTILYANEPAGKLLETMGCRAGQPLPEELLRPIRQVLEGGKTSEFDVVSPAQRVFSFAMAPSSRVGRVNLYGRDITERKQAEERARLLSEINSQLLASDQPQQIVEALCRQVMDYLGCHAFFNFLVDEKAGRLHLNAYAGIAEEAARQIEWLDYGVAVCGCAARDGCRIVAEHIQTTPDPRTDLVRSLGIQAYACHPLLNQGDVIGTLSFGSRSKPTFAAGELALMHAVADHVAIAMQRIHLLESLQEHARTAEAANAAKGRFLANMSHELRTPMNAILGMIDVALPKALDPTVQDCLQTAKGSADLLLTLLDDLLDSAKIESGKLELESTPFSLRRMLDQITHVLAMRASEHGLAFFCRIPDPTPDVVVGDRTRLQQVLLNLAGNAIKFTERGEVEISVEQCQFSDLQSEISNSPSEICNLTFAVRDTGIGIPPSVQERLFQPFAQADTSMARRFGGTGLGLSICKNLVEMMDGRIWVESEVGKGSTFCFTIALPVAKELSADFERPVAIPAAVCNPLRILLVEDNPANQKLATYFLLDRGHAVEIAGNGQEAIQLTEQNRYDMILMDVQMPEMDGLEATAAIRQREAGGRQTPIVAMTAYALKGDRERCLAAGMDAYITKPIQRQDLNETIARLAEKRGSEVRDERLAMSDRSQQPEEGIGKRRTRESSAGKRQEIPSSRPLPSSDPSCPLPASPPFNRDAALARLGGEPKLFREMVGFFFSDGLKLVSEIVAAAGTGDAPAVEKKAHRLKGTVLYLGAEAAVETVARVEAIARAGDLTDAAPSICSMETEITRLAEALRACGPDV